MKFCLRQMFLLIFVVFIKPNSALDLEKIGQGLDNIFLGTNITAEETKSILASARESYQILNSYNKLDLTERKQFLNRVKTFANRVIDDLAESDMSLEELFGSINSYLKGVFTSSSDDGKSLKTAMPMVMRLLAQKINQHHSQTSRNHYDVIRILSGSGEEIFRETESINPTTIGYFFLEVFATIFGLSWGIISMLLPDFE